MRRVFIAPASLTDHSYSANEQNETKLQFSPGDSIGPAILKQEARQKEQPIADSQSLISEGIPYVSINLTVFREVKFCPRYRFTFLQSPFVALGDEDDYTSESYTRMSSTEIVVRDSSIWWDGNDLLRSERRSHAT